ncbi:MAG: hypothetical protein JSW16_04375 [Dehalococcoidales bacterium]|nr:MAG: hypothetical protein JSW16_04375 [Dehalococcoidales bacterium]
MTNILFTVQLRQLEYHRRDTKSKKVKRAMKKVKSKQSPVPTKKPGRRDKSVSVVKKDSRVYGELGNGTVFLLTPQWLSDWEKPPKKRKKSE